jgi:hypothetical protein
MLRRVSCAFRRAELSAGEKNRGRPAEAKRETGYYAIGQCNTSMHMVDYDFTSKHRETHCHSDGMGFDCTNMMEDRLFSLPAPNVACQKCSSLQNSKCSQNDSRMIALRQRTSISRPMNHSGSKHMEVGSVCKSTNLDGTVPRQHTCMHDAKPFLTSIVDCSIGNSFHVPPWGMQGALGRDCITDTVEHWSVMRGLLPLEQCKA